MPPQDLVVAVPVLSFYQILYSYFIFILPVLKLQCLRRREDDDGRDRRYKWGWRVRYSRILQVSKAHASLTSTRSTTNSTYILSSPSSPSLTALDLPSRLWQRSAASQLVSQEQTRVNFYTNFQMMHDINSFKYPNIV